MQQSAENKGQLRLGPLRTLSQVIAALGKVIRAMADGSLPSQDGARLANALGVLRSAMETQMLENLRGRLDALEDPLAPIDRGDYPHARLQ